MSRRTLIAVTHLLGSGHLVRARHLASALARAGHAITLASGGMPIGPPGDEPYAFVQLPPVQVEGTDFRTLLDETGAAIDDDRRERRRAMLAALAASLKPDIVITEHFPFGRRQLAQEFLALIAAARAANPAVLTLSSIRDVLVTPRPDRIAQAHARIAAHFDAVLVHGDRSFLPLEASWPVTPELRDRLRYTGYLASPSPRAERGDDGEGEFLVSGGGSGAALPVFDLALAAAGLGDPARRWRVLAGRGLAEADFARLQRAAPRNLVVERARPDFAGLLASCALSISQSGYNTVLDLVEARRPALVIPFDAGAETEQTIRAQAMERAGLARCLPLSALTPERLNAAIDAQLLAGAPAPAAIDRDGAGALAAIIGGLRARTG